MINIQGVTTMNININIHKINKKSILIFLTTLLCLFILSGCNQNQNTKENTYMQITAKEAKNIMETETDYIILDVRTEEEFKEGHIKNALLIPDYEIAEKTESVLTNKEQLILVYCRSGRRSKIAANELTTLGYSNIKEFGGIIDWPYDVVTE